MRRLVLLALPVFAACAGAPSRDQAAAEVEEARAVYGEAAADGEVQERASMELSVAAMTLDQAERVRRNGASAGMVVAQARIAAEQARSAVATAHERAAEARAAVSREPSADASSVVPKPPRKPAAVKPREAAKPPPERSR